MARNSLYMKNQVPLALGGTQDIVPLPKQILQRIDLLFRYTVTDAGISAGENIDGLIDSVQLTDGRETVIDIRRNELAALAQDLHGGTDNGAYVDADPTTATEQLAYFTLEGPWDLSKLKGNPVLDITLRPATDEWGGATALTGAMSVAVHSARFRPTTGLVVKRFNLPSSDAPEIDIPSGATLRGLFVNADAAGVERYHIAGVEEVPEAYFGHINYASRQWVTPSQAPTTFAHYNLDIPATEGGRKVQFETDGTSIALNGFMYLEA